MDNTIRLWVLLSKQQDGSLSGPEAQELDTLLKDPANNEAVASYARLSDYWEQLGEQKGPDAEKYWQQQKDRLEDASAAAPQQLPDADVAVHKLWYQRAGVWLGAAAAILIVLGISLIFRQTGQRSSQDKTIIVVHNGSQKQLTLPDGSKVWLNSGSELSYNKYFASAPLKEIFLKGEAFFDIQHDPSRTFIIHTEYLDIKDLGTRFNVKAYLDEDKMETTLLNGSVEVYPKNHPEQMIRLSPNEKVVIDTKALRSGMFNPGVKGNTSESALHLDSIESRVSGAGSVTDAGFYVAKLKPKIQSEGDSIMMETAWMQHQLAFSATTFAELAKKLERWYDVEIVISNSDVANYIFSGIFKEETFKEALSELQMIQPFQFEIQDRTVHIY